MCGDARLAGTYAVSDAEAFGDYGRLVVALVRWRSKLLERKEKAY